MVFAIGSNVKYVGTTDALRGLSGKVVAQASEGVYTVAFGQKAARWNTFARELFLLPPDDAPVVAHGGKDDKGKPNPALLFEGCAPALAEVNKVLHGGAQKYSANSWQTVPNGIERYKAAFYRHLEHMQLHGWDSVNTDDFDLLHIDHAITDLLFIRSLMLKKDK